jgi:hypothetical protein
LRAQGTKKPKPQFSLRPIGPRRNVRDEPAGEAAYGETSAAVDNGRVPHPPCGDAVMEWVVRVLETTCKVFVERKEVTLWTAVGEYKGQIIHAEGRSTKAVLKSWKDAARNMGKEARE